MNEKRFYFREPILEIFEAADLLKEAAKAHCQGNRDEAEAHLRKADMKVIWEWTDSIWGSNSPYVKYRKIPGAPTVLPQAERIPLRMPNKLDRQLLHQRDGFHCRFCGIPVIRKEVREWFRKEYPKAVPWQRNNKGQHAAFQAMWLQYDHIIPHARGGTKNLSNLIVTCAPCNFGRMSYMLEEVGLRDPRLRQKLKSEWDGLETLLEVKK